MNNIVVYDWTRGYYVVRERERERGETERGFKLSRLNELALTDIKIQGRITRDCYGHSNYLAQGRSRAKLVILWAANNKV